MMEYTLAVIVAGTIVIALDKILQTKIISLKNVAWKKTTLVFLLFQFIFDNLFTYWGIWKFNASETLGIFVPFIPLENVVYGQILLAFTLVLMKHFEK